MSCCLALPSTTKGSKPCPEACAEPCNGNGEGHLAGLALLLVLGQAPALPATINVSGGCTLVRAIVAANNDTTASGNCTKGSGADKIVLPRISTERFTVVNNTPYGPTGLPIIRSNITIAGNNSIIRRLKLRLAFASFL